jgi:hypothetical protein
MVHKGRMPGKVVGINLKYFFKKNVKVSFPGSSFNFCKCRCNVFMMWLFSSITNN